MENKNTIMEDKQALSAESDSRFNKFIDEGVEFSLLHIKHNYEDRENPLDDLAFHNTAHTKTIIRRVDKILEKLGADSRTRSRGKLNAGFHDLVQNWQAKINDKGHAIRDRSLFPNEEDSFKMEREYMEGTNKKEGSEIFTSEDVGRGEEAIMATKASGPGSWDKERNTIIQPNLKENSPLEVRALALADIGGAGMDGGAQFVFEGDALFHEENLDILEALGDPEKMAALTDEQKNGFREQMLAWSKFQPLFAEGRKARFEMEISGLTEEQKDALRKLFNKFDKSIAAAKRKAEERESMEFEDLALDFGYAL